MRLFHIDRTYDVTGVSGTGVVAEGVEFTDGTVVLRWLGSTPSTVIHESLKAVERIHCHEGKSRLVFHNEVANGR